MYYLCAVQSLWKSDQIHAEIPFPATTVNILTLFIFLSTPNKVLIIIWVDSDGFWMQILNSDWIIDQRGLISQTRGQIVHYTFSALISSPFKSDFMSYDANV